MEYSRFPDIIKVSRHCLAMAVAVLCFFAVDSAHALSIPCKTTEVGVFQQRIHVRCDSTGRTDAYRHITFFAVSTAYETFSRNVLELLLAAHQSKREVILEVDPSSGSGQHFGCLPHDCVNILYVYMR